MVDLIWIAAFVVFAVWWFIVADLDRAGVLKKYNMTAYGPLLMIRTFRGQKLLDRIAGPKRLWRYVMLIGIPVIIATMLVMLATVIFVTLIMLTNINNVPPPGPVNQPQNILAIPGINQFIPFFWGWVALIIAMLAHEFGHAILAKVENIKVKSLGLMVMPIPIGAFAEIDEEELFGTKSDSKVSEIIGTIDTTTPGKGGRKTSCLQFTNILGAGVMANFLVAAVAFLLLFGPVLGSIAATDNNMMVDSVVPGSPADIAGMKPNTVITAIDGKNVTGPGDVNAYVYAHPNGTLAISGILDSKPVQYTVSSGDTGGVLIATVTNSTKLPAYAAGVKPNMKIVAINGTPIANQDGFLSYMNGTHPGQTVVLGVADNAGIKEFTVTLGQGADSSQQKGFIGISTADNTLGIVEYQYGALSYLNGLKNMPYSLLGWLRIVTMPVLEFGQYDPGFNVFHSPYASLYTVTGWAGLLGDHFPDLVDCLFWVGWLNFNIGIFNCLPMIPLDGGHIFRELARSLIGRFVKNDETVDKLTRSITNAFAVTLLAALCFMILAPYLVQWLIG